MDQELLNDLKTFFEDLASDLSDADAQGGEFRSNTKSRWADRVRDFDRRLNCEDV